MKKFISKEFFILLTFCIVIMSLGFLADIKLKFYLTTESRAADTKISDLAALTAPTTDDLLYVIDDPVGTPTSKKATIANIFKAGLYTILTDASIAGDAITAAQATATSFILNDSGGAVDYAMPSAIAGLSVYVKADSAHKITLDSAAGDIITLIDGTNLTAANAIDSNASDGASIRMIAVDSTYWKVVSQVGAWSDGGAD